jgi:hypothetical protein
MSAFISCIVWSIFGVCKLFSWHGVIHIPKCSSVHDEQDNECKHCCVVVREWEEKKIQFIFYNINNINNVCVY